MKKDYEDPILEEEEIEIEDVILPVDYRYSQIG